jgi:hypothetical protein
MIHLLADISNYTSAVISLLFGIIYLIKPSFLGYHKEAAQKNWEDLDEQMQTLILALMRAISGGAIVFGFIVTVLQFQFSKSMQIWIPGPILFSGAIFCSTSLYAMLLVRVRTKGKPPVIAVLLSVILLVIGYLLNTYIP